MSRLNLPSRASASTLPDMMCFLQSWAHDPLRVAAIAPSGAALAKLITSEIGPDSGPVLELGPGTGVFTHALLARGIAAADLTLVENGEVFAALLRGRFPEIRVLHLNAAKIKREMLFDGRSLGAVISGIPILSMSPKQVMAVLGAAFALLREGGAFYQFTYGLRCPISPRVLQRLDLTSKCVGRVYRNIPPAAVYRISRGI